MTTKLIGMKEFRQNLSKLGKKSHAKKIRFIVMNHMVPIFKVEPMNEDDLIDELILEKYGKEIEEALQQVKEGEVYTTEEVRKHLGL
ncbi:hypothetical protein HY285_00160 [Candidatus Peregrinibacteria bacterium]|nr:hypothetical protein [Candidatus Peregrinibacteria bacterium]MBI3815948.1 hypothetical protein [Candidatus Peregrinibacteria bacterium]